MAIDAVKHNSLDESRALSLVDQAAMKIRSVILKKDLQSGEQLPPEHELIEQLGVSRTVVREAIGQLQTIGLVEIRRGCGTFVNDRSGLRGCVELIRTAILMSAGQLRLFTELRGSIESAASCKAAEQGVDDQVLIKLERIARDAESEGKTEEERRRIDLEFHLELAKLANNSVMLDVIETLQELMIEGMARTTPTPRACEDSLKTHLAIVEAIRARDPQAAHRAVDEHMRLLISRLENVEQSDGDPSQKLDNSKNAV